MHEMNSDSKIEIIDITENRKCEWRLYKCLAPMPFRKYRKRREYLEAAIPKRFHKKVLIFNGQVVGQIEYAPPEACGYPITGNDIIVMNCIWVLKKAKGRNLGKQLLTDMVKSEKKAFGFATIALENHWSPWFKKWQIEKLGFKSLDSVEVMHKTKHKGERFKIHLMWLPATEDTNPPTWDKTKLLEGEHFCIAHPLYHPEKPKLKKILKKC
jgi:N-acetylglutamate synthase-like GNAT family acetyltransferase